MTTLLCDSDVPCSSDGGRETNIMVQVLQMVHYGVPWSCPQTIFSIHYHKSVTCVPCVALIYSQDITVKYMPDSYHNKLLLQMIDVSSNHS